MNDRIEPELCLLSYVNVDEAAMAIRKTRRVAFLAKVDIKEAYRIVPVHPEDCPLLGMVWEGASFFDAALPFGLRSAPKIFTALADALEWLARQEGVESLMHYLDEECRDALHKLLSLFGRLKVPVAPEKLEGP